MIYHEILTESEVGNHIIMNNKMNRIAGFVDKSVIELYADDRQAVTRNIYPKLGGTCVKIFARGGDFRVISAKTWELLSSNTY